MICENYKALSHMEQQDYISNLLHCVRSDNEFFTIGIGMIEQGKQRGLFDKVTFRPDLTIEKPDTSKPDDPRKDI